jgi:CSLREA domain-containing protein
MASDAFVAAFSPNLGTQPSGRYEVSVDVHISGGGGASYYVEPGAPSQNNLIAARVAFASTGGIFVTDNVDNGPEFIFTGTTWVTGQYRNLTIELDADANTIDYYYADSLIYSSAAGVFAADAIENIVLYRNNAASVDTGDFDNLSISHIDDTPPPTGEIRGTLWNDFNGNAEMDLGEPPLEGWTVYIDENNNGQFDEGELSTVTDGNGEYVFTDLAPRTYTVAQVVLDGWEQTFPAVAGTSSTSSAALGTSTTFEVTADGRTEQISTTLANPGGYLTEAKGEIPRNVALDYVRNNFDQLGLLPTDVADIVVSSETYSQATAATQVVLVQRYDGVEILGTETTVLIDADGRILGIDARFERGLSDRVQAQPERLTAAEAVVYAAGFVGIESDEYPQVLPRAGHTPSNVLFASGAFSQTDIHVRAMYQVVDGGEVRLVWHVQLLRAEDANALEITVDAETGAIHSQTAALRNQSDSEFYVDLPAFSSSRSTETKSVPDRSELAQQFRAALTTTGTDYDHEFLFNTELAGFDAPMMNNSTPLINLDAFRADPRFSGIDGSNLAVVVLDSGIDLDHPFFGPDTTENGVADRIVFHYDFFEDNADATDLDGHGTSVTSIIASSSANSTYAGVAPGVDIIHLKVFPDVAGTAPCLPGQSCAPVAVQEQALQWIVDNVAEFNIVAVNMSLGGGNFQSAVTQDARRDEFAALAALNVISVAASGNSFFPFESEQGVAMPSADPDVISVGAVWSADHGDNWHWQSGAIDHTTGPDRVASFSQRHEVLTDTFAPGPQTNAATINGGTTSQMGGTSAASPHVAGAAVLAQQVALQYLDRLLTPGEFRALLQSTGVTINDGDDENDNVVNTGLDFPRLDMLALGDAIWAMGQTPPGTHQVTVDSGQVVTDVNFGNRQLPPAEIVVTTFNDIVDPNDGVISLREAVIQANETPGDVTIVLSAGTYNLTIGGANENVALTGDLDVLNNGEITIVGAGAGQTTIDAGGLFDAGLGYGDRIFDVHSGACSTSKG